VKIVVCDGDSFMLELVQSLVRSTGHDVLGIADTTPAAVGLIETGRPDAVVLDLSLGYNTDFDITEAAISVGARAIVFTENADAEILGRYSVAPAVVVKPDLEALEQVLRRLGRDESGGQVTVQDRRRRPIVVPEGEPSAGPNDAPAFFEAVNGARSDDALVTLEVPLGAEEIASEVRRHVRDTDRVLLMLPRAVRVFLPGGGKDAVASVMARVRELRLDTSHWRVASVIVGEGEDGAAAFERMRSAGELHPL
jgi:CheY-like chemotaxis protein